MSRIFKYLHPNRIEVIENRHIRFTQPSNFNDPFESLPSLESIVPEEDFDTYSNIFANFAFNNSEIRQNYSKEIKKIISENNLTDEQANLLNKYSFDDAMALGLQILLPALETASNLEDTGTKKNIQKSFREGFDKSIGILSLTEKPDNMLMWSHYANSHKGFVIEFDKTHSFFDQRENSRDKAKVLRKVSYVPDRPHIVLLDPQMTEDEILEEIVDKFILTKSNSWEYEQEWRMAHALKFADKKLEKGEDIYLFKFPADLINRIIFGSRMSPKDKSRIISQIEANPEYAHVKLMQAELDQMKYQININPIN